jgi:MerR family transcriptional regulator, copper efflux regulator
MASGQVVRRINNWRPLPSSARRQRSAGLFRCERCDGSAHWTVCVLRKSEPTIAKTRMPRSWMNIGEASRRTGLTARAIRLYEASGIIGAAQRGDGGYRRFNEQDLRALTFVHRARQLGFDLESIRQLVGYWRMGPQMQSEVTRLLDERIAELRRCEAEMRQRREILESTLVDTDRDEAGCRLLALLLGDNAAGPAAAAPSSVEPPRISPARRSRRQPRPAAALR